MNKRPEQWSCLVVDDEPLAADLVCSYIATVEELKLSGVCHNALDALAVLRRQSVDLLFLDIQMPKLTGLELIRTLQQPPSIIIISAYREFAVEGFELDVADYLVKPVTLERFLKAVSRVMSRRLPPTTDAADDADEAYVYYKSEKQMVKVYLKDILWIESIRDYIKVVLEGGRSLITYQRISYAEEKLPASLFLRVHRSFMVARNRVTGYASGAVLLGPHRIPIGKSYLQTVRRELCFE